MSKTCIVIVALLGVFVTSAVAAPMSSDEWGPNGPAPAPRNLAYDALTGKLIGNIGGPGPVASGSATLPPRGGGRVGSFAQSRPTNVTAQGNVTKVRRTALRIARAAPCVSVFTNCY